MNKSRIVIIGCGSLGKIIGEDILEKMGESYELLGFLVRDKKKAGEVGERLGLKLYDSLDQVLEDSPDYIVEAAGPHVVVEMALKILEKGINFIPLSVGALADGDFYKELKKAALENSSRVYIPSGALGGFDLLRSAMLMGDAKVRIKSEKGPRSLEGAPFLEGRKLSRTEDEEIFRGSAREAISLFPNNINVAVATALATSGVDHSEVSIHSVAGRSGNKHTIDFQGEDVDISISIDSLPSPENPRSSSLAAYSVIALLENLASPIVF